MHEAAAPIDCFVKLGLARISKYLLEVEFTREWKWTVQLTRLEITCCQEGFELQFGSCKPWEGQAASYEVIVNNACPARADLVPSEAKFVMTSDMQVEKRWRFKTRVAPRN